MVNKELLEILCCPETKQDVMLADASFIALVNKKIEEKAIKNRGGNLVKEKIDGGLIRLDKKIFYPIRSDIPIMLIDEGISLDGIA